LLFPKSFVPTLTYTFKHVLIQEAAYHSLPASRRQHDHRQVAQVLIEQFPEIASAQPEVLAQHYTEAGATTQALPVWQRAGQRAAERSAHLEAIAHFTRGLASLQALPDTPERDQHELTLQLSLGVSVISTQGYAAPDVKRIYIRARTLCQRLGEHAQLADVLRGLWYYHTAQGQPHTARELGEQLLMLGQRLQDQALRLEAHRLLGTTLARMGELLAARAHLAQALSLYDPHQHGMLAFRFVIDPGAISQAYVAWLLWMLGYPDQARQQLQAGLTMAAALPHPFTKGLVCVWASVLHQWFREAQVARELAETAITLSTERGFPFWRALGTILRGWALTVQAQHAEGMAQVSQGLAAWRTLGEGLLPLGLALAAETSATLGQTTDSLMALDEALALVEKIEERFCEAELYRLKGEMLRHLETPRACLEAEACFQQALAIARRQSAKSWELRAATSLARLWQQQGKRSAAGLLLTEIYGWFTEGFETPDLQDARALLDDLR
jgi:predicted ATPase